MSDLFGSTATPQWMAPEQRQSILDEDGRANAASFNQAFQSAFGRQQQEKLDEKLLDKKQAMAEVEMQRTQEALSPIIQHAQGLDSTAKWLQVNTEHPEYMLNPRTQPYWMEMGKNLMQADGIKQKSLEGQQEIQRVERRNDWTNNFGLLTADERSSIAGLAQKNQGKIDDKGWLIVNGKPVEPSPEALSIVDTARKREGYAAFGMDKSERLPQQLSALGKLQQERQQLIDRNADPAIIKWYDERIKKENTSQVDVADERGKQARETEQLRQQDRINLEKKKQEGRLDVEKLKASLKPDSKGNVIGEEAFINRHYNSIYASLRKEPIVDTNGVAETAAVSAQRARQILQRVYKSMAPGASAAPATTKTAAAPAAATPAPAAAPAASNSDPLGLFLK